MPSRRGGRGGGGHNPQRPRFELLKPVILQQDQGSVTIEYTLLHGGGDVNGKQLTFTMRQGDKDVALLPPGDQKTGRIGHENGKLRQAIPVPTDVKLASITATAVVEGSPSVTINVPFNRPQPAPHKLRFTGYKATSTGVTVSVELTQDNKLIKGKRILFTRDGAVEAGSAITGGQGTTEFKIKIPSGTKAKIGAQAQVDGDPSAEIEVHSGEKEAPKPHVLSLDLLEQDDNSAKVRVRVRQDGKPSGVDDEVTFFLNDIPQAGPELLPDTAQIIKTFPNLQGVGSCKITAKALRLPGAPADEITVTFEKKEPKPYRLKLDLVEKKDNTAKIAATIKQGADVVKDTQVTFYRDGSILPKVAPDTDGITTLNITVPEGMKSCKILAKAMDIEGTPSAEIEIEFDITLALPKKTNVIFNAVGPTDPDPSMAFRVVVTAAAEGEPTTLLYEIVPMHTLTHPLKVCKDRPDGDTCTPNKMEVTGTQVVYVHFDNDRNQTSLIFQSPGLPPKVLTFVRKDFRQLKAERDALARNKTS